MAAPAPSTAPAVPTGGSSPTDPTHFDNTGVAPTPVAATQAAMVPNATEIPAHTGATNTFDPEIYLHWVTLATVTWTVNQLPGTLLWYVPIHPSKMNGWVVHLLKMYNTWGGDFDFQAKIAGTGFHAGSATFVRIPPNIHPSTVDTPEMFTCFDWSCQDPKALEPFAISIPDQKPISYHYGQLDLENPNTFGGYLALYVTQRLNTSSSGSTAIDIMIWNRPGANFTFSQLIPPSLSRSAPAYTSYEALWDVDNTTPMTVDFYKVEEIAASAGIPALRSGRYGCRDLNGLLLDQPYRPWFGQPIVLSSTATGIAKLNFFSTTAETDSLPDIFKGRYITAINPNLTAAPQTWFKGKLSQPTGTWSPPNWYVAPAPTSNDFSGIRIAWNLWEAAPSALREVSTWLWMTPNTGLKDAIDNLPAFTPFNSETILTFRGKPTVALDQRNVDANDGMYIDVMQTKEMSTLIRQLGSPQLGDDAALLFVIIDRNSGLPLFYTKLYPEGYFTIANRSTHLIIKFDTLQLKFSGIVLKTDVLQTPPEFVRNQMLFQAANKLAGVVDRRIVEVGRSKYIV